jgi:hypothetical protein
MLLRALGRAQIMMQCGVFVGAESLRSEGSNRPPDFIERGEDERAGRRGTVAAGLICAVPAFLHGMASRKGRNHQP